MRLNSSNNTDTDSYCMFWGSEDCRYQNWRLCWSKLETPNHLYSFGGTELFAWPLDISSDSAPTSGTWVFPMHLNVNGGSGSTGCLDVRTRLLCFDAARNHFRASPRKMAKKMKRRDIHRRVPQWLFWWWWCQNHWNPWRPLQFCEDGGGKCLRSRNWIIMAKQVHFIASLLEEIIFEMSQVSGVWVASQLGRPDTVRPSSRQQPSPLICRQSHRSKHLLVILIMSWRVSCFKAELKTTPTLVASIHASLQRQNWHSEFNSGTALIESSLTLLI